MNKSFDLKVALANDINTIYMIRYTHKNKSIALVESIREFMTTISDLEYAEVAAIIKNARFEKMV